MSAGAWTMKRSSQASANAIQVYIQLIGDQPVHEITKANGRRYKELLQRYPKNFSKAKQYRGMTAL